MAHYAHTYVNSVSRFHSGHKQDERNQESNCKVQVDIEEWSFVEELPVTQRKHHKVD